MEWSGRAPAPPAIEAGKGRQRQGAHYVTEPKYRDRHASQAGHEKASISIGARSICTVTLPSSTSPKELWAVGMPDGSNSDLRFAKLALPTDE